MAFPGTELNSASFLDKTNLKAYYRFESGALTTDSSGAGHTLTAISDPAEGTGKFGGGVDLDGNDAYSATNHADFRPTGNFTIGAWVKQNGGTYQYIFNSLATGSSKIAGIQFYIGATGKLEVLSGKNTGVVENTDYVLAQGSVSVNNNAWRFVVATWDGSKIHLYVDGSEDGTGKTWANAPAYQSTNYVRVGCASAGTDNSFFTGSLDDVFLYNGTALSAAQILSLYSATLANDASGSVASADNVGLIGNLSVDASASSSSAGNVALIGNLQIDISGSASSSDNVQIARNGGDFTINDAASASSSGNVDLVGNLIIDISVSDSSSENVEIIRNGGDLGIADSASASSSDEVSLVGNLQIDDSSSLSSADNITIYTVGNLQIQDSGAASTADNVDLELESGEFSIADSASASVADNVSLIGNLSIDGSASASSSEDVVIENGSLEIDNSSSLSSSDNLEIIGNLIINNAASLGLAENVILEIGGGDLIIQDSGSSSSAVNQTIWLPLPDQYKIIILADTGEVAIWIDKNIYIHAPPH